MIRREIAKEFHQLLGEYPVVTVLGPRQAGKTTLVRRELPDFAYCNLESPEMRSLAETDPKALLNRYHGPVILDEIQRTPELLSYIQAIVDEEHRNGRFVITGSHQLALHEAISQSLAGRTAILTLYPLSIAELRAAGFQYESSYEYIYRGFLPRIYDQNQRPTQAYSNYFKTYVERDVRQLINIKDLSTFDRFMRLLAGRAGQLMDYTSLANDTGIATNTVKQWLSILEASFVVFRLNPYFENFGKRVIKSPKYYFADVGLLAFLLGINEINQLQRDPLIGQVFENLVVLEVLKSKANRGEQPEVYFYRDSNGVEVDLLVPQGPQLIAIEIKLSETWSRSLTKNLSRLKSLTNKIEETYLVYSGQRVDLSEGITALRFNQVGEIFQDGA